MLTRRDFLCEVAPISLGVAASAHTSGAQSELCPSENEAITLCGDWQFRIDPEDSGKKQGWHGERVGDGGWRVVNVPHTWQIESTLTEYCGVAWYRRAVDVPGSWKNSTVRIEFEAVFHTADVWVNGQFAGAHTRKGYTAFILDVTGMLRWGAQNTIVVRVDSAFSEHMVPRGLSSDWATDGGIYRPVQLIVTPKVFVEQVDVEAVPDFANGRADLKFSVNVRNSNSKSWRGTLSFCVIDTRSGLEATSGPGIQNLILEADSTKTFTLQTVLSKPRLWHFDDPHLYRIDVSVSDALNSHHHSTAFGVRKFEVREGKFYLNNEHVRLMGVERMAGSNPTYGMAEPNAWIEHHHDDLKFLNCVFTRVHWPQDRRVLDYCDQHGILIQTEVPAWGEDTFKGMGTEPDADIMENGLEQLREMIAHDRNHPSVVVWGLCNEIEGGNPPAYSFAKRLLEEAKKLDPNRLCTYASNSVGQNGRRDVAVLMDFIEVNEYFGSWVPGSAKTVSSFLDELHHQFPDKPIVVSEYGYCACVENRPEGDGHRVEVLRSHTDMIRSKDYIAGTIFFCYNDYRTHVGFGGVGALKQNTHGVVDVYGKPKASYSILRQELSPVELFVENQNNSFHVRVAVRGALPMHALTRYRLRGLFYGQGDVPIELQEENLPDLSPGSDANVELKFTQTGTPRHMHFDVLRPTGFSACSLEWTP